MRRVQVTYTGRVQGVGFRATTRAIARGFPITGWVRNEPDGSVTLVAQGEQHDVAATLDAITQRMKRHITDAAITDIPPISGENGFEIQR
ncbi:MAG: acylphosphatase [Planctomycetota bacterium]